MCVLEDGSTMQNKTLSAYLYSLSFYEID